MVYISREYSFTDSVLMISSFDIKAVETVSLIVNMVDVLVLSSIKDKDDSNKSGRLTVNKLCTFSKTAARRVHSRSFDRRRRRRAGCRTVSTVWRPDRYCSLKIPCKTAALIGAAEEEIAGDDNASGELIPDVIAELIQHAVEVVVKGTL